MKINKFLSIYKTNNFRLRAKFTCNIFIENKKESMKRILHTDESEIRLSVAVLAAIWLSSQQKNEKIKKIEIFCKLI